MYIQRPYLYILFLKRELPYTALHMSIIGILKTVYIPFPSEFCNVTSINYTITSEEDSSKEDEIHLVVFN